jgi:antirestriction protein
MKTLEPKIYVACLAAYNNGYLHGKWIEANQGIDHLWDGVKEVLAKSPIPNAEEFAIHDFEDFGSASIEEYTSLDVVAEIAAFIAEHGELGSEVLGHTSENLEEARQVIEECYHGEFNSEEDFAYYWMHEVDCREIPDYLHHYIDYQAMARDFFITDFFSIEFNHKVHVFSHH